MTEERLDEIKATYQDIPSSWDIPNEVIKELLAHIEELQKTETQFREDIVKMLHDVGRLTSRIARLEKALRNFSENPHLPQWMRDMHKQTLANG